MSNPQQRILVVARRHFLRLCSSLGVSLLPLGGCRRDDRDDQGSGESDDTSNEDASSTQGTDDTRGTGATDDGGSTGDTGDDVPPGPFPVPPLDDGEVIDGVRVFRLKLQQGQVEWIEGNPTATYGVNGPVLGPTLRFRKGERVRVEVTNDLDEASTLHWHGLELPARSDGGPYQLIEPGETWISEYDVVQRAMTAWYHPHPMHMTARHVYMGMAGFIYLEDPAQDVELPSTYGVDDLPLVIQDRRFFANGTHPYSPGNTPVMHDRMAGLRGDVMLVNGLRQPTGVVPRGLVRLRLLNGSNARIYNIGFGDDRSFQQIASDGGLLAAPKTTSRVLLAPGERAEILVDFGSDETGTEIALQSYSDEVFSTVFQGNMGNNLADDLDRTTFEIMTFEIGEPPAQTITPPAAFAPIEAMLEADAVRTRTLALSMGGGTVAINGVQMTHLEPVPDEISFDIPAGSIELWELIGSTGMAHPVHIHNRHFQSLDIDGQPPPPELAGWKDTVVVGPQQLVRILVSFEGNVDPDHPYMFHCHILEHEDLGMMGRFFIIDP
jgi:blue copper oxidase